MTSEASFIPSSLPTLSLSQEYTFSRRYGLPIQPRLELRPMHSDWAHPPLKVERSLFTFSDFWFQYIPDVWLQIVVFRGYKLEFCTLPSPHSPTCLLPHHGNLVSAVQQLLKQGIELPEYFQGFYLNFFMACNLNWSSSSTLAAFCGGQTALSFSPFMPLPSEVFTKLLATVLILLCSQGI